MNDKITVRKSHPKSTDVKGRGLLWQVLQNLMTVKTYLVRRTTAVDVVAGTHNQSLTRDIRIVNGGRSSCGLPYF